MLELPHLVLIILCFGFFVVTPFVLVPITTRFLTNKTDLDNVVNFLGFKKIMNIYYKFLDGFLGFNLLVLKVAIS